MAMSKARTLGALLNRFEDNDAMFSSDSSLKNYRIPKVFEQDAPPTEDFFVGDIWYSSAEDTIAIATDINKDNNIIWKNLGSDDTAVAMAVALGS